ncbi:heme exporter protein CcmD [Bradyrhizobium sp. WD16]|uniref:heme exporter protein CcmD n=1 Tax=Bradyrhizobium sp. WD16 TaxID=1521768 RepID=UPI0020A4D52A|nr:heme exporter protein CcmD [Bradyrhizobium sp. WD16]UTD26930.1 heme exporter protein CcmD [Bradyrhizobium sp. WD16]
MVLGPYASFIVSSYAVAAIVVAALVIWVIADYRRQKTVLADLEAKGITRRSGTEVAP